MNCRIYEKCSRDCTHCEAQAAVEKTRKMKPRRTTIFEGERAKICKERGITNYETYKCPACNWIVADRSFTTGIKISNFCENCGQALELEEYKLRKEDGK